MSARAVLLGMNNPLSSDPDDALVPWPDRCSGHRLWRLLSNAVEGGVAQEDYLRAFERRNLLPGREWDDAEARATAPALLKELTGRRVVVLGSKTATALGMRKPLTPLEWHRHAGYEVDYALVPHPSGLNQWYNAEGRRALAGRFLAGLCREGLACVS